MEFTFKYYEKEYILNDENFDTLINDDEKPVKDIDKNTILELLNNSLEEIDFTDKLVGIFGCGDQEDYADYFCDAIGTVRDIVEPRGAIIVGNWPTDGYTFESSKALLDDGNFIGLCIDEDRQPELTAERVEKWTKQIYDEMCLAELA